MTNLAAPLRCIACGRILKRAAVEVTTPGGLTAPLGPGCARVRKLLAPVQRRVFTAKRTRKARQTPQIPLGFA